MQRTVRRGKSLLPFACDLAELETLVAQLATHTGGPNGPRVRVTVRLAAEELAFDSVAELRDYSPLPSSVTRLDVFVHPKGDDYPEVFLDLSNWPRVTATSSSEAWSAGATEIALAFAKRHGRWYAMLGPLSSFVLIVPLALAVGVAVLPGRSWPAWVALASGLGAGVLGAVVARWVLPDVRIDVRRQENSLKRYAPELSVVLAVLALVVAVLAWLRPRAPAP